jgi:hypothetical protein
MTYAVGTDHWHQQHQHRREREPARTRDQRGGQRSEQTPNRYYRYARGPTRFVAAGFLREFHPAISLLAARIIRASKLIALIQVS